MERVLQNIGGSIGSTRGDSLGQDVLARHLSLKHHSWRGKYQRVWALTAGALQHADPADFSVTNTWPWSDVVEVAPASSSLTDFTFTVKTQKKTEVMKFSSEARTALLVDMARFGCGAANVEYNATVGAKRVVGVKFNRLSMRTECALEVGSWYLAVVGTDGRRLSTYSFTEITAAKPVRDDASAFVVYAHGRPRLFATPERAEVLKALMAAMARVGIISVVTLSENAATSGVASGDYRSERLALGNDGSPRLLDIDVIKVTGAGSGKPLTTPPRGRKLVVTEASLVERDGGTYAPISARALPTVFGLVAHWDDPQKLTIEYRDGSSRSYLCGARDALLGALLDACRNAGNASASVFPEPTRHGDRLLSLAVDDDADNEAAYIEGVRRAGKAGAPGGGPYSAQLARAAQELVVNTCGLGLVGYGTIKKSTLAGVLPELVAQAAALLATPDAAAASSGVPATVPINVLSAITRIVATAAGYRMYPTLPEAGAVIMGALRHEHDGVVYAGAELLRRLMHNPRRPRDSDEDSEAAVKRSLLSSEMRVAIIQALDVQAPTGGGGRGGASGSGGGASGSGAASGSSGGGGGGGTRSGLEGTLTIGSLVSTLDSILVSHVDTTPAEAAEHLLQLTASRYAALLALFRSPVAGILESSAMLIRAIVDQADLGTCRAMQSAALSSGVWLRHFFNAVFAPSLDARYVSRYLVELWTVGNLVARDVVAHMVPPGLVAFLDVPRLQPEAAAHLEALEAGMDAATAAAASRARAGSSAVTASSPTAAAVAAARGGLAGRLKGRLEQAERASQNRVKRRLVALDEGAAGAKRGRRRNDATHDANMAAAAAAAVAAQAAITRAKMTGEVAGVSSGSDSGAGLPAIAGGAHSKAAAAAAGAAAAETNCALFFFQTLQDHVAPDLIWNQQTRSELKAALDAELREIEREIELGGGPGAPMPPPGAKPADAAAAAPAGAAAVPADGRDQAASTAGGGRDRAGSTAGGAPGRDRAGSTAPGAAAAAAPPSAPLALSAGDLSLRVAWNFAEFEVEYPSLAQELRVGDYYLRLFLEGAGDPALAAGASGPSAVNSRSNDHAVASLREPGRFFDALYRRVLRESAPHLRCMCLRGMSRVYEVHWRSIGPFDDTDYVVYLLSQASHAEVRDRLLMLLRSLALHPANCEKMINPDCLELLVDLLTTAHTTDMEHRSGGPALGGGGAKGGAGGLLMLTNGTGASAAGTAAFSGSGGGGAPASEDDGSPQANPNPKESLRMWYYRALKGDVEPGEKPEKGPYSLQDLARLGEMHKLTPASLVWAQGMREWVRLDSLRAIQWYCLSEGTPALSAHTRGELCCELLLRLVTLRPSLDAEGAPVRPVPRAKRVLCGPRTLPHIAQALLAGSPRLVELISQLLLELVAHNPKAMVKLYMSGVFYFALGYGGSNWGGLAALLGATHLSQSFHSDAASLGSETSLGKRSILGTMLPESLITVLANRGPAAFASSLLANVDSPEVIWKYSMRSHVVEMVSQHLGDLPSRLAANPCTLYDYCPIPPVKYSELEHELWCASFYLANLCDEARFPDWAISDPVGLLRSVLDAWRAELVKGSGADAGAGGGGVRSEDEALGLLGLPKGVDDKEIRKAYRRLAIKFHPDKNPTGRETFEKINKAYDLLTSARGVAASNGPDPVSVALMVRTQCILFGRHGKVLKAYKYAGYPLLLDAITGAAAEATAAAAAAAAAAAVAAAHAAEVGAEPAPAPSSSSSSSSSSLVDHRQHLEACTRLVFLTCLSSPKNADELVRERGTEALLGLLSRILPQVAGVTPHPTSEDVAVRILDNVLHTLSGLATLKDARERALAVPGFPAHLVTCIALPFAPRAMQYALETVARLAASPGWQEALVGAGVVYRLLPLLFRYDPTLEAAQDAATSGGAGGAPSSGSSSSGLNEQRSANMCAKLALRALARLGGYLDGADATPANPRVRAALAALLTPPLARRLRGCGSGPGTDALLRSLCGHEESAIVVWTGAMRKELLGFLAAALEAIARTGGADLGPALAFTYSSLREELRVAGVYVRFYIADPPSLASRLLPGEEIDHQALALALLRHVGYSRAGGGLHLPPALVAAAASQPEEGPAYDYAAVPADLARRHLRLALRALHLVAVNSPGTEAVVARHEAMEEGLTVVLVRLLERSDASSGAESDGSELLVHAGAAAGHGGNKAAAGSGASAGAGGARSTPAPPNASLRELVLTVVAAIAPYEQCAGALARLHLLPVLLRQLGRDSGAIGPILRTLFAHSPVIAEIARTGAIIDLAMLFAGGVASGPAPGKPGGPPAGTAAQITVPKPARAVAAALLSLMCSDASYGPVQTMALSQLIPDTLALAVKESVSGSTGAGAGSSASLGAGVGLGAAGAGGGTGAGGDVVMAFEGDHETPELIWNAVCRHELRCALGELTAGLGGLRKRAVSQAQQAAAASGAPPQPPILIDAHGDGVGWSLPATFRVRYSPHEGELRVGGVYVRLFLKEPTFPLREPKALLEALLRRLSSEADLLCGLTSDDADKAREAATAAAAAAKAEEAAGGVASKTRAGAEGDNVLVLRGEDVSTQITHAVVCSLRVRPSLADHLVALGYVPKLVSLVAASVGKPARYNLGVQALRVLQTVAGSKACVQATARANFVSVLLRLITPLPRDTAFALETLKLLLETDAGDSHALVEQCLRVDGLIPFLVGLLERSSLDHLVDPSAAKVHSVAILKVLESDGLHGPSAQAALATHRESWERYRHQKHDLFLSRNDTRDYFLTDSAAQPAFMLKNSAEWGPGAPTEPAAAPSYLAPPPAAAQAAPAAATLHNPDITMPPPAPEALPEASRRFGGFQAPAPAPPQGGMPVAAVLSPVPVAQAQAQPANPFGFAAAPAPAPAVFLAPAPAAAPAQSANPFFAAPAPAPQAVFTPVPAGGAPIQLGFAPGPAAAGTAGAPFILGPAPVPAPGAAADPFSGLLGSPPSAPVRTAASGGAGAASDPFGLAALAAAPAAPAPASAALNFDLMG